MAQEARRARKKGIKAATGFNLVLDRRELATDAALAYENAKIPVSPTGETSIKVSFPSHFSGEQKLILFKRAKTVGKRELIYV